jgi:phenylpyruvate tautomerase PptA (4-oxalocrotonate tautomerase family)
MPYARIEIASGRSRQEKAALLAAVDAAFVATLGVPPKDAFLRLFEFAPENAQVPPHHGPRFTFVEVQLFAGRDEATKAALYAALREGLGALGVPAADLTIALIDLPRRDWGIAGATF